MYKEQMHISWSYLDSLRVCGERSESDRTWLCTPLHTGSVAGMSKISPALWREARTCWVKVPQNGKPVKVLNILIEVLAEGKFLDPT